MFVYLRSFQTTFFTAKVYLDYIGIQSRIVKVEGKHVDR